MCGYACCNCGRCRGEAPKHAVALEDVPGYCRACGELNRPTAKECKACGTDLPLLYREGDGTPSR